MKAETMISIREFCIHHKIELEFIHNLTHSGLIEVNAIEDELFIPIDQLSQLEKLVRFHYEMDINLPGIESISHLLNRISEMQLQILKLNNKLRVYEA